MGFGQSIDGRDDIVQGSNDSFFAVVLGFHQEEFNRSSNHTIASFQDGQSFVCLSRADQQITRCSSTGRTFIAPKCREKKVESNLSPKIG